MKTDTRTYRRWSWLAALLPMPIIFLATASSQSPAGNGESGAASAGIQAHFTEEQARRGWTVYIAQCAGCHGSETIARFTQYPNAYLFYNFISGSMPYEAAGSLPRQDYIDLVALFMMQVGFPFGETELVIDQATLAQIVPATASGVLGMEFMARQFSFDEPLVPQRPVGSAVHSQAEDHYDHAEPAPEGAPPDATMPDSTTPDTTTPQDAPTAALPEYFTAAQADRGRTAFIIACGGCHSPTQMRESFATYPHAGVFYGFMSAAMPADAPGSMPQADYLAILAYMMREQGFPAGATAITADMALLSTIIPAAATPPAAE